MEKITTFDQWFAQWHEKFHFGMDLGGMLRAAFNAGRKSQPADPLSTKTPTVVMNETRYD